MIDWDDEETPRVVLTAMEPGALRSKGSQPIVADCGHASWISPSSLDYLKTTTAYTVCGNCFLHRDIEGVDIKLEEPLDSTREELVDNFGEENAEKIIESSRAWVNQLLDIKKNLNPDK